MSALGTNPDPLSSDADATDVADAVRRGDVAPREVLEAAIRRIEAADAAFSFLAANRFEQALDDASRVDRGQPLAAVPVLIKDYLATCAGMPYTAGSRYAGEWVASEDSEYVARLRRAGAVIVGVAKTPEMALLSTCEPARYGAARNPRAPGLTTGGSSGASAAAVASGAVPAAHANDAGGSIRIPSACCGVFGLKPTRARNPLGPAYGDVAAGLWAEHVVTRSVRDSAAFLDATHGPASGDPYCAPSIKGSFAASIANPTAGLRVAVSLQPPAGPPPDAECVVAVERTEDMLCELGHQVMRAAPDFNFSQAEADFFTLFCTGLAADVDTWQRRIGRPPAGDDLEPYTWGLLERGRATSGHELLGLMTRLQREARAIAASFTEFDVWLTPTLTRLPVPLGYFDINPGETAEDVLNRDAGFTAFLWIANTTGRPAMSVPAHFTDSGVPVGAHFLGRFGDEQTLLGLAAQLESAFPDAPPLPTVPSLHEQGQDE